MKPFHFSLESLLVLRRQKEEEAQIRHAKALTAREQATTSLEKAAVEVANGMDLLSGQLAHGVSAATLLSVRAWCSVLENRRKERKMALDEARQNAENSRQKLVVSTRERETLDRFHDKSLRAHEHAVRREEQKNFDEIAVQTSETCGPLQIKLVQA